MKEALNAILVVLTPLWRPLLAMVLETTALHRALLAVVQKTDNKLDDAVALEAIEAAKRIAQVLRGQGDRK